MVSKRRRSSEAAEPAQKRARSNVPSSEDDLTPHHKAEISNSGDIEDETRIHASTTRVSSTSGHSSSHKNDDDLVHHDNEWSNDDVAQPSDHSSSSFSDEETPEDDLTQRIRAAIAYTTISLAAGLEVEVTTQFRVPLSPPHPALSLLRPLSNEPGTGGTGLAHFIYADALEEVYELGMPGPLQQDGVDPRWFHGQSRAEVRAGPFAEQADVRAAARVLRGMETRATNVARANGGRTNRQAEIVDKLAEGLRRQVAGERMNDSSSESDDISVRSGDSDDHGDNISAPGPSSSNPNCDNEVSAPQPREVRFVIESSIDSSDETPAPRPRVRPVVYSSTDSSNEAPAPRPRARPVFDSSSNSSDEPLAPRLRSARPVIQSSSLDTDEEPHIVGSRLVATTNVHSDSSSEEAPHDEFETEPVDKEEASATNSRSDESKSDSAHEGAPDTDSNHEEDAAKISHGEESEDEPCQGNEPESDSSDNNEPEADSSLDNAPESEDLSTEESDYEPVDDVTDGDEYVDGSSDEESQDEVVVPRRSGRVRVQRKL